MDWLMLYAGKRTLGYAAPAAKAVWGLLPAQPRSVRRLHLTPLHLDQRALLLRPRETVLRGCDPLSIQFHAGIADLKRGEARVLRVRQRVDALTVGGYTVVLMGK